ncbi:hypothetical protein [Gordonia sp. NPDC003585]|uniref:hypothetical protein n=1 Tax=Gordonia sp. NPDC003585 TaxID=3154275 RepID=UPI0033A203A0
MSEYQYYEFMAIDRPLTSAEQAQMRSLSTRARISATGFVNEYEWGDFRGSPDQLMEHFYDAHLYLSNWGSRRLMLRLPREVLDIDVATTYCTGEPATAWSTDDSTVLDFFHEGDGEDDYGDLYNADVLLSTMIGVRAELAAGDLRPLYLAWLGTLGTPDLQHIDDVDHEDPAPPIPPGLADLTPAQDALAEFLGVDDDLLAIAAESSPELETRSDTEALAAWISSLPSGEKDDLLLRVASGDPMRVQVELSRRFVDATTTGQPATASPTAAALITDAAQLRTDLDTQAALRRAENDARREQERAAAYERKIEQLASSQDVAWSQVDSLISARKPDHYDAAVALLTDLRTVAERGDSQARFTEQCSALRKAHSRKVTLIERLDLAGI